MTSPVQSVYNWYRKQIGNPKYRWWIIIGTVVYLISPFDFLPDVIPVIGQIDDMVLVSLLMAEVAQVLGDRIKLTKERRTSAPDPNPTSSPSEASTVDVNAVSID